MELDRARELAALRFGKDHQGEYAILERKVLCYIALRDKKNAKKSLQRASRFGDPPKYITMRVKKMKHKPRKKVKHIRWY